MSKIFVELMFSLLIVWIHESIHHVLHIKEFILTTLYTSDEDIILVVHLWDRVRHLAQFMIVCSIKHVEPNIINFVTTLCLVAFHSIFHHFIKDITLKITYGHLIIYRENQLLHKINFIASMDLIPYYFTILFWLYLATLSLTCAMLSHLHDLWIWKIISGDPPFIITIIITPNKYRTLHKF
ncbi:hypothetical protein ACJX0J_025039 [Zea mays]